MVFQPRRRKMTRAIIYPFTLLAAILGTVIAKVMTGRKKRLRDRKRDSGESQPSETKGKEDYPHEEREDEAEERREALSSAGFGEKVDHAPDFSSQVLEAMTEESVGESTQHIGEREGEKGGQKKIGRMEPIGKAILSGAGLSEPPSKEGRERESEGRRRKQRRETKKLTQPTSKGERLHPLKRGGRPRGPTESRERGHDSKQPKPEIVCWNDGWEWTVGIELPDGVEIHETAQNGLTLEADSSSASLYPIENLETPVTITGAQEQHEFKIISSENRILIFKMKQEWKGLGRLVKVPSRAHYLAVVPREWERDEGASGPAPVAPQNAQSEKYKVHFYYLDQNEIQSIAFLTADGERIQVSSSKGGFQLVGKQIGDASEEMGPLFAGRPPLIHRLDQEGWSQVDVIVVGKEGVGRRKWRTQFRPREGKQEQEMPKELVNRQGGWYFVRIYDRDDGLIESLDFRFMSGLEDVRFSPHSCLPGRDGHQPVKVSFHHGPTCEVKPLKELPDGFDLTRDAKGTHVSIPAMPAWDVTDWELRSGREKVNVEIMIERIWWSLVDDNESTRSKQSKWLDKSLSLERNFFRATSAKAIRVWIPKLGWTDEVWAGFDRSKGLKFPVTRGNRFGDIPLHDFCDSEEVSSSEQMAELKLWLEEGPTSLPVNEVIIGTLAATASTLSPEKKVSRQPLVSFPGGDVQVHPSEKRSCSTCDHARTQHKGCWCRRHHWPKVVKWIFDEDYAGFVCEEWRGEYYDAFGGYHTNYRRES